MLNRLRTIFRRGYAEWTLTRFEFTTFHPVLPGMCTDDINVDRLNDSLQRLGQTGARMVTIGEIVGRRVAPAHLWWAHTRLSDGETVTVHHQAGVIEAIDALTDHLHKRNAR